ncbi:LacI family DNA-binding transcriptional regulator [Pseudoclavibacter helvolus]|uniref:LacI family DNA-binding transcriptional regulator n=1 Tax=Pseudoclavibacter helvolus TaxID=255205 RepID=UPI003C767264
MPAQERPLTVRAASVFDVARAAGVSHQTVSRVLNSHPSVRESTRAKVLDAMRELDYRPNLAARTLSSKRSRTLGVISTSRGEFGPASSISAITEAARSRGYSTIIEYADELSATSVDAALTSLAELAVEGIVAVAPQTRVLEALQSTRTSIPFVTVQNRETIDGVEVASDQFRGARLATEHLLRLGHRKIVHLAGPIDWLDATSRLHGYEHAMTDRGLPPQHVNAGAWSPAAGYQAGRELLAGEATAIFCSNDQLALGVLHAAHELGVEVPGRVSIVGFDDIPEAAHFWPPLTTVRQDFSVAGRRCVEQLLDDDDAMPTPTLALVHRASTAPVPA